MCLRCFLWMTLHFCWLWVWQRMSDVNAWGNVVWMMVCVCVNLYNFASVNECWQFCVANDLYVCVCHKWRLCVASDFYICICHEWRVDVWVFLSRMTNLCLRAHGLYVCVRSAQRANDFSCVNECENEWFYTYFLFFCVVVVGWKDGGHLKCEFGVGNCVHALGVIRLLCALFCFRFQVICRAHELLWFAWILYLLCFRVRMIECILFG